jgi:hypothetical protein
MTHSAPIPDWVTELTGENFLALYDVAFDIRQELQMSDDPVIPLWQPIVKFPVLLPVDSIGMRDRYCELRWKATRLLQSKGIIRGYELLKGSHRWGSRLRISAERPAFEAFVKLLDAEYKRRGPAATEAHDTTSSP